ncbi:epidermal growth factor receptor substrate 15-like 1 [Ptychodera flava]|uniref:epidermal growth factor receptor substrate 15-like 1 n=1 Tax=Ptychodera flava TaxID=63121 RepID=UPI00396A642A
MAALAATPISLITGSHVNTYEGFYKQVDPLGTGKIGAIEAAAFLKRSGLKETVLHKIWELSDPTGKGFLDKQGFFTGLKLIALAQNGKEVSTANIALAVPPPNMGGGTLSGMATPPLLSSPAVEVPWVVGVQEKTKFDGIFDSLHPVNGLLSGEKCKTVFMNSNLPVDILSRVWDLSDIDKDGFLDRDEFSVAMYLVYRALDQEPIMATLPPNVIPPSKRKKTGLAGGVAVLPSIPAPAGSLRRASPTPPGSTGSPSPTMSPQLAMKSLPKPPGTWVVSAQEKANSDNIFKQLDSDNDGLVTGEEVRGTFMQYGIPQNILAHIWSLCDMKQQGKLNAEQFALALYLINQKAKGVDPPQTLAPEMIPPSSRPKPGSDLSLLMDGSVGTVTPSGSMGDFSGFKELDLISKEIEQLGKEKTQLQQDLSEKEEISKRKTAEVQELQKELDTANAQLKQLESQKSDAQRKLDELDERKKKLESTLKEVKHKCEEEEQNIKTLKSQIATQENTVKSQDEELNRLRVELNSLRQEESVLEQKVEAGKTQLEVVMKSLKETQQQISQENSKISKLKENQNIYNNSIEKYNEIIQKVASGTMTNTNDIDHAVNEATTPTPSEADAFSMRATAGSSPVSSLSGFSTGSGMDKADTEVNDDFKDDPFKGKDPFGTDSADPFQTDDPFKGADPFKSNGFASDPFAGDPFKDADPFGSSKDDTLKHTDDPFKSIDPFKSKTQDDTSGSSNPYSGDPFGGDPFDTKFKSTTGGDAFGSDPFSSQEPMPALPPKRNRPGSGISAQPLGSTVTAGNTSSDPFDSTDPFQSAFGSTGGGGTSGSSDDKDPFGFGLSDPFGGSSTGTGSSSTKGKDPFAAATIPATDPFSSGIDPFSSSAKTDVGVSSDAFAAFADFGSAPTGSGTVAASEEEQIAWATKESERAEKERQRKIEQQEQDDLERALALSRSEAGLESDT